MDYGSITLLFQDPSGGLQVKRSDGGYIDVPYMPDAVLVNLGVLMQQWTADGYVAAVSESGRGDEGKRKRRGSKRGGGEGGKVEGIDLLVLSTAPPSSDS